MIVRHSLASRISQFKLSPNITLLASRASGEYNGNLVFYNGPAVNSECHRSPYPDACAARDTEDTGLPSTGDLWHQYAN